MNKYIKGFILIALFIFVSFILIFRHFCPLFNDLPLYTGRYSVGEMLFHWKDIEDHYELNNINEFNVDVFYPTSQRNSKKHFAYQANKINALKIIKREGSYLPQWVWNCLLGGIKTFAEPNALMADDELEYPVIIYLPGIAGDDLHNIYLEELASHGYVVFAIEPPYDTNVTVFPDNDVITLNSNLRKAISSNDRKQIYEYRNNAHVQWSKYIDMTIDTLKHITENKESLFYKRLDLNAVGLLGHSHGGAVVLDFCQKNKICKAGINMDGWTKTYNSSQSFAASFLFLLSENGEMPEMQELFNNNKRSDFMKNIVHGAGHLAFSDIVLIKQPILQVLGISSKNQYEVVKEISTAIVSFFNQYLKHLL